MNLSDKIKRLSEFILIGTTYINYDPVLSKWIMSPSTLSGSVYGDSFDDCIDQLYEMFVVDS